MISRRYAMLDAGNGRVQFALYITIYADKIGELDRLSDEVESIFGSRLVYSRRAFIRRAGIQSLFHSGMMSFI